MVITRDPSTMVPADELLTQVLPTDRLLPNGVLRPDLRAELRRIPDLRNAVTVLGVWAQGIGIPVAAAWVGHPLAYVAAFVLMAPVFARFAILGHEAAHRLLFTNKTVNDVVGKWLVAYPAFVAIDAYRRAHMAHHRDEFGPDEPDLALYRGYPIPRASFRRKLVRDAIGISGWKNLLPLFRALRSSTARPTALGILGWQLVLLAAAIVSGHWWLYPLLWLGPWMTGWRVLNRLRSIAEHGGLQRSDDRRQATHTVHQSWIARCLMVPYHTGWHLAHHVDMGIPWRSLPRYHAELVAAGYVPDALEWPNYRSLWRAMRR